MPTREVSLLFFHGDEKVLYHQKRGVEMKRIFLCGFFLLILGCDGTQGNNDNKLVDDILDQTEFNLPPDSIIKAIKCGEKGACEEGQECVNEIKCCPAGWSQICEDECYPSNCKCIAEDDFTVCVPVDMHYCGLGVSCPLDHSCVYYENNYYCLPPNMVMCSDGHFCEHWQVCADAKCCPKESPIACGEICCYPEEKCVAPNVCLPQYATWCGNEICVAGYSCAIEDKMCFPATGEYCGNKQICYPGFVCDNLGGCCPQGIPQRCGSECCPNYFDCVLARQEKKCVPEKSTSCGDVWCPFGKYCADHKKGICVDNGAELCIDGHICGPGLTCSGPTCCPISNPQENCGLLCCPKNWQCIKNGEACIPPDATYIGEGKYCESGTFFNKQNGKCEPIGYEPCGKGPACPPDMKCSQDGTKQKCCPAYKNVLCGDECCLNGYQCIHDGDESICIPPGAEYCGKDHAKKYCPYLYTCGKKKKECIPFSAQECDDGSFCEYGMVCTSGTPKCCPWNKKVPCNKFCCGNKAQCVVYNGKDFCLDEGMEICHNDYLDNDFLCFPGEFCPKDIWNDGYCLDDKWRDKDFMYCGGGNACLAGLGQCGGLCQDICCDLPSYEKNLECLNKCTGEEIKCKAYPAEDCETSPQAGFGSYPWLKKAVVPEYKISCTAVPTGKPFAFMPDFNDKIKACYEKCFYTNNFSECKYGKCGSQGSGVFPAQILTCPFYPKTNACLKGCMVDGQVCLDKPSSVSINGFIQPNETYIFPENVEVEVGGWCEGMSIDFAIFGGSAYTVFYPAGLSDKYVGNTFRAELEKGKWVNKFGYNSKLYPEDPKKLYVVPGDEVLFVDAAWVIDTMEGKDCPHGPYGQLYWLIYQEGVLPKDFQKKLFASQIVNSSWTGYKKTRLSGPFNSFGINSWYACVDVEFLGFTLYSECWPLEKGPMNTKVDNEWASGIYMRYDGYAGLYKWEENEEGVYLTLMEADPASKEAPDRRDDFAGFAYIDRQKTKTPCGLWVPLYKYDNTLEQGITGGNNDYYYKTDKIAIFLRLRTFTCTGKPEDPC